MFCDLLATALISLKIAKIGEYSWLVAFSPMIAKSVFLFFGGMAVGFAKRQKEKESE